MNADNVDEVTEDEQDVDATDLPDETGEAADEQSTIDWADEAQQAKAVAALERVARYGDEATVEQAIAIQAALQTEEGVRTLFEKAGQALGVTAEKLASLFAVDTTPEADEDDPDRVMTYREFKELMEKEVTGPAAQRAQEAQHATATATVNATLATLGVTDAAEVRAVLAAGQQFIKDGDFDPAHIKEAVEKGFAEYERAAKARFTDYVAKKVADKKALPGSIGGNSPGGDALPEPTSLAEAKKRAREALGIS